MEYVCCFGKTKILSWVIFINFVFVLIFFVTLVDIGYVLFNYSFKNILISLIASGIALRACYYFHVSVWRDRNNAISRGQLKKGVLLMMLVNYKSGVNHLLDSHLPSNVYGYCFIA